jgi:long-chain acyl-CoA synthetase
MEKKWQKKYVNTVPYSLTYPDITLQQFLIKTAGTHPEYLATTLNEVDITYGELNKKANKFAHALQKIGVKKGDRVSLILVNSPTYVIAFFAVLKLGAVVVNLSVATQGEELVSFLNDAGSKIIVTLDLFVQNVYKVVQETMVTHVIIHSLMGLEKNIKLEKGMPDLKILNDLAADEPEDEPESDISSQDLAVLQYTSGATGTPKAVALSHANIVASVCQSEAWVDMEIGDAGNASVICIIPFFHVFGMSTCLLISILKGYRMILIPRFDSFAILPLMKTIEDYRPIFLPAVPSLWAALLSYPDLTAKTLGSIEVATSGGASLPHWVSEKFEELTGRKLMNAYGLSEASSATHCMPYPAGGPRGSIGLPLPDTDAKIVDIEKGDRECEIDEIGELVVKGPQIMAGYWNNPELTARTIRDGWLFTGDMAHMDGNGFFYLVDRKDDLIISSGFNVYPSQIENVLMKNQKVKESAVIGIPDRIKGESIVAIVVLEKGTKAEKEEFIEYCRQRLPDYKIPKRINFRDQIPKNPAGKPLRKILRKEFE